MAYLPQDPLMLLSYVNMKLRDFYPSLSAFCEEEDSDEEELREKLRSAGYEYDAGSNRFV